MKSSDYRESALYALDGNWGKAILAALIAAAFGALLVGSNFSFNIDLQEDWVRYLPDYALSYLKTAAFIGGILGIIQFIIGGVIQLGYCRFLLDMEYGHKPKIRDLFSEFDRFGTAFMMNLLRTLYTVLWTLLFIIPGIVAVYRYAMAPFILAENPYLTANEAITESKERMRGNKLSLFLLDLSFIGWHILSILTLGVGYIWLNPYINSAYAAFYRNL